MQHICKNCGESFESPHRTAKYCCRSCSDKHRHIRIERVCRNCGEQLTAPGQIKLCYCSRECRDADPSRTVIDGMVHAICRHCEKPFTHPNWRTNDYCSKQCADSDRRIIQTLTINCEGCGNPFQYHSNRPRRFCTRSCWYKYATGENNPTWNSVEVECENCHKTFFRESNHANRNKHQFCTPKCSAEFYSNVHVGPAHPLWKGGAYSNRGKGWHTQRRLAWIRDNYSCKACGKTKKQLGRNPHVHHITPFRLYGLDRAAEANRLDNLICLCHTCHNKAEHGLITFQLPLLNG